MGIFYNGSDSNSEESIVGYNKDIDDKELILWEISQNDGKDYYKIKNIKSGRYLCCDFSEGSEGLYSLSTVSMTDNEFNPFANFLITNVIGLDATISTTLRDQDIVSISTSGFPVCWAIKPSMVGSRYCSEWVIKDVG